MSKSTKPALRPVPKPVTEEEKNLQVIRFLANEKKTYFQIILSNLLRNESITGDRIAEDENGHIHSEKADIHAVIDLALDGADYIIEKMYPVEKKED